MLGVESVVYIDVSGDVFNDAHIFALADDEPMEGDSFTSPENDHDRLAFMEDVLEGSKDIVSPWESIRHSTGRIEVNGVESRFVDSMRRIFNPVVTSSSRLVHKKR
jgi:hypothetical protein